MTFRYKYTEVLRKGLLSIKGTISRKRKKKFKQGKIQKYLLTAIQFTKTTKDPGNP